MKIYILIFFFLLLMNACAPEEKTAIKMTAATVNKSEDETLVTTNPSIDRPVLEKNLVELAIQLKKNADDGQLKAQYELGQMYYEGSGVVKDYRKAAYWFKKAAEQNSSKAKYHLGLVYRLIAFNIKLELTVKHELILGKQDAIEQDLKNLEFNASNCFSQAHPILIRLASEGDAEAQFMLGRIYSGLWNGHEDKNISLRWYIKALEKFKKSAEMGNVTAQVNVAEIYTWLPGPHDSERIKWLTEAAKQGEPTAQFKLGSIYKNRKEYVTAIEWLTKAAEQSHIEAQYELGMTYNRMARATSESDKVRNFRQSEFKAVEWLKKAAQKSHSEAQYELAVCYNSMEEIRNPKEALHWFTKAAEHENKRAQGFLALMYYIGEDAKPPLVQKDYDKALKWFKRQAEKDFGVELTIAQQRIANIYYTQKNYIQAFEWFEKAANRDDAQSQYMLGELYYKGLGSEKNLDKAIMWYTKAAKSINYLAYLAQFRLARMYFKGEGVIQDYVEAYKWANLAAMKDERYYSLRDIIKKEMTPEQIAEGQKKARELHDALQQKKQELFKHLN
jgi:TPR repeat protein